jgi:dTDP-4-dehydrorhamnose 3,5-epimerase-like enzyme
MTIERTDINGVLIINNFNAIDDRGLFVKTFNIVFKYLCVILAFVIIF